MDNSSTMRRVQRREAEARSHLNMVLVEAGYQLAPGDALPENVRPRTRLADAIAQWREADQVLTAAEDRSPARW